jgi:hypothetical protein
MKGGFGQIGNMWKSLKTGDPKALLDQAKAAEEFATKMKGGAQIVGKMPGLVGTLGKAMGALGGVVGSVSKLFAGPVGWAALAATAIVSVAMKIDSFVKDANKRFAAIRGPDIFTKDVGQQMTDFNLAITDIASNLHDGLKADEVYAFAASIAQSGKRLQDLSNSFYSFRDVVSIAAKASKVLGIDIQRTGDVMSKFSIDYEMDIKQIDQAFVQVAFDAGRSGISTEKFLAAVENASSGLAFYGVFVRGASKAIADLTKSQVVGATDAGSTVTDLMQKFKNMSITEQATLVTFMSKGGQAAKDMYASIKKQYDEQIATVSKNIVELKLKGGNEKEIETLQNKQAELQRKAAMAQQGASGDLLGASENLGEFSDKAMDVFRASLQGIAKGLGGDIGDLDLPASTKVVLNEAAKQLGLTADQTRQLLGSSRHQSQLFKNILVGADNLSGIQETLVGMNSSGKESDKQNLETLDGILTNAEKDSGSLDASAETLGNLFHLTGDETKTLIAGLKVDKKNITFLKKMVHGDKVTGENVNALLKETSTGYKMVQKQGDDASGSSDATQKAYDDTFVQLRNHTLSLKDMSDITKDGLKAQLYYLDGILSGIDALILGGKEKEAYKQTIGGRAAEKAYMKGLNLLSTTGISGLEKPEINKEKFQKMDPGAQMATAQEGAADLSKKMDQQTKVLETLETLGSENVAATKLGTLKAQLKDPNTKKEDKEAIQDQIDGIQSVFDEMAAQHESFDKVMEKQKTDRKKLLENERIKLAAYTNITKYLPTMDENAQKTASLIGASLTKEGATALRSSITSQYGGSKMTPEEAEKKFTLTGFKRAFPDLKLVNGVYNIPSDEPAKAPEKKAGLTTPEMVTNAGLVHLDPGETIHPAQFKEAPGAMGGGGAGGGKNITININATEKDLAQRIAMAVRGVLYEENIAN